MPDGLQGFYDNLLAPVNGKQRLTTDQIGDYSQFSTLIADSANRNKFYNNLINTGFTEDELGDFDTFNSLIQSKIQSQKEADTGGFGDGTGTNYDTEGIIKKIDPKIDQLQSERYDVLASEVNKEREASKDLGFFEKWANNISLTSSGASNYGIYNDQLKKIAERNPEYAKKTDAIKSLENAKDFAKQVSSIQDADNMRGQSWYKQAYEGFVNSGLTQDFWSAGVSELARNFDMLSIADKVRNGEKITEGEEMALGTYSMLQDAMSNNDASVAYMVGQGVKDMLPYMASFAATSGAGTSAKAGVNALLKTSNKKLRDLIKDRAYKEIIKRTGAYAAGAAAQTPLMPMMYSGYAEKRIGGFDTIGDWSVDNAQSKGDAAWNAFSQTYAEVFSERLGEAVFQPMSSWLTSKVGKIPMKLPIKINPGFMSNVKKVTAWDGFLLEYLEELENTYMANIMATDGKPISEVWDNKEQFVTLLTVAAVGGAMTTANTLQLTQINRNLEKEHLSGLDDNVKTGVKQTVNLDLSPVEIAQKINTITDGANLSPEQTLNVRAYAAKMMSRKASEAQLREAYAEMDGNEITQNLNHILTNYAHEDGERIIQITDTKDNIWYVRQGEVDENDDGFPVFSNPNIPLTVVNSQGQKELLTSKDVKQVTTRTVASFADEYTSIHAKDKAVKREAEIPKQPDEQLLQPGQELTLDNGKKARIADILPDEDTGIDYIQLVDEDGNAVNNIFTSEQVLGMINREVEQKTKQGLESKAAKVATETNTEQPQSRDLEVTIGKKPMKLKAVQGENGTYNIGDVYESEKEANTIQRALSDKFKFSDFSVINTADVNDPFAVGQFIIVSTPKTKQNDTNINQAQETTAVNEENELQAVQQEDQGNNNQVVQETGESESIQANEPGIDVRPPAVEQGQEPLPSVTETKTPTLTPEQAQQAGLSEREVPNKTTFKTETDETTNPPLPEQQERQSEPLAGVEETPGNAENNEQEETVSSPDRPIGYDAGGTGAGVSELDTFTEPEQQEKVNKQPWEMTREEWLKTPEGKERYKLAVKQVVDDEKEAIKSKKLSVSDRKIVEMAIKKMEDGVLEGFAQRRAELIAFGTLDKKGHVGIIQQALTEGKPVPPEVLAEYPDLVEKANQTVTNKKGTSDVKSEESKVNTSPSEAQKEAGNYQKGHITVQGMDITIEQPKGSTRSGYDENGGKWETKMNNTYGYFKRTKGKDGDQIDVFLGDNLESEKVYVVDQNDNDGNFDEHKVMLGFNSAGEAARAYYSNYHASWTGLENITEVPVDEFKKWMGNGTRKQKPFAEYKNTPDPVEVPKKQTPEKIESIDQIDSNIKEIEDEIESIKHEITELEKLKKLPSKTVEQTIEQSVTPNEIIQIAKEENIPESKVKEAIKNEIVHQINSKSYSKKTLLNRVAARIRKMLLNLFVAVTFMSNVTFHFPHSSAEKTYDNLKIENLTSFDKVKLSQDEINKLDNINKITWSRGTTSGKYIIIDKNAGLAHLYKSDELITTFEVGTGLTKGDAQTKTIVRNGKVYWEEGNKQTGAGIYTVNSENRFASSQTYTLLNENGIEVPTVLHETTSERRKLFNDNNSENNRMSNGCVNFQAKSLSELKKIHPDFGKGSKVYILPDNPHNIFAIEDGELKFISNDPNVNRSISKYNPYPITIVADNVNKTGKEFLLALSDSKISLMSLYPSVSNDVYNQIVKIAYGIFGQESSFGTYGGILGQYGRLKDEMAISLTNEDVSAGVTQIRLSSINEKTRREFNINSISDIKNNTVKAAQATMSLLLDIYENQIPAESKIYFEKLLPLAYSNRVEFNKAIKGDSDAFNNQYIKNVIKYGSDVKIYIGLPKTDNRKENNSDSGNTNTAISLLGLSLIRRKNKGENVDDEIDNHIQYLKNRLNELETKLSILKSSKSNTFFEKIESIDQVIPQETKEEPIINSLDEVLAPETKKRKRDSMSKERSAALALEVFDPYHLALQYFIGGGKINYKALFSLYGTKGKDNDQQVRRTINEERKRRMPYYRTDGATIDQIAHTLWENNSDQLPSLTTEDYREAVEDIISSYKSPQQMAESLLDMFNKEQDPYANMSEDEFNEYEAYEKNRADIIIDWLVTNNLKELDEKGLLLSDPDVYAEVFGHSIPKENEQKGTKGTNEQKDSGNSQSNGQKPTNSSQGNEQKDKGTSGQDKTQQRIADQQKVVDDLTMQLKSAETEHTRLKTKLETSPEHGGKGQSDISGNVAGSDLLGLDFDNAAPKKAVDDAKRKVDELRQKVSEETIKLNELKVVQNDRQGELFGERQTEIVSNNGNGEFLVINDYYWKNSDLRDGVEYRLDNGYLIENKDTHRHVVKGIQYYSNGSVEEAIGLYNRINSLPTPEKSAQTQFLDLALNGLNIQAKDFLQKIGNEFRIKGNLSQGFTNFKAQIRDKVKTIPELDKALTNDLIRKWFNDDIIIFLKKQAKNGDLNRIGDFLREKEVKAILENDQVESPNSEPETIDELPESQQDEAVNNIKDFGEKIGGARKDIAESGVRKGAKKGDGQPGWMKKYKIFDHDKSDLHITDISGRNLREKGKVTLSVVKGNQFRDIKRNITREEAEQLIPLTEVSLNHRVYSSEKNRDEYSIFRRWSSGKLWEIKSGFKTREEAMQYMALNAVEIIEYKTPRIERPHLDNIERKGVNRRKGNISPEQFSEAFGFRGTEFGNWLPNDERQSVLNMAYDALHDLADVIGVPPAALSLGGRLSVAFGSRGQGLSSAAAHYEPDRSVINLTRVNGAGSLAHEWFHAADHYFGLQNRKNDKNTLPNEAGIIKGTSNDDYYLSGNSYRIMARKEVRDAWKKVWDTMRYKTKQNEYDKAVGSRRYEAQRKSIESSLNDSRRYIANARNYGKKRKPATEEQLKRWDKEVEKLLNGDPGELKWIPNSRNKFGGKHEYEAQTKISAIYKEVTGRGISDYNFSRGDISYMIQAKEYIEKAKLGETFESKVATTFYTDSKEIDKSRSGSYWSTNHEMAARAFESFMFDQIAESNNKNDYLVHSVNNAVYQMLYDAKPYPEGQERLDINKAFKNFFDVVEVKEENGKQLMFQKVPSEGNFYSPTLQALESIKQEKATPEQWKAMLLKNGAKEAELEWMGFDEFVKDKKTLTKNDLSEFVKQNEVQLEEVVKEVQGKLNPKNWEEVEHRVTSGRIVDAWENNGWKIVKESQQYYKIYRPDGSEIPSYWTTLNGAKDRINNHMGEKGNTKYSDYQLPGGENYKEWLLTMPVVGSTISVPEKEELETLQRRMNNEVDFPQKDLDRLKTLMQKSRDSFDNKTQFKSSHFDEPNIVVHIRTNERTDSEGDKVLFIEEVQSDWQQEGRKDGFKDVNKQKALQEIATEYRAVKMGFGVWLDATREQKQAEFKRIQSRIDTEGITIDEFTSYLNEAGDFTTMPSQGVPNMPFQKSDQIIGLALKRMVKYAAENGFDKVAWTTGEQQAERYDLSKQVDYIEYSKDGDSYFVGGGKGGELHPIGEFTESTLPDAVGKDVAQKIIDSEGSEVKDEDGAPIQEGLVTKRLKGIDLKVGGEGMTAFYDKMIPSTANKLFKKYGVRSGETLITTELGTPTEEQIDTFLEDEMGQGFDRDEAREYLKNDEGDVPVHSITLTDQLKKQAGKGFPTFKKQPSTLPNQVEKPTPLTDIGGILDENYLQQYYAFEKAVKKEATRLGDILGVKPKIVLSEFGLPRGLRKAVLKAKEDASESGTEIRTPGFFDPATNQVYVIMSNIDSTNELPQLMLHEAVGHKGLRAALGKDFENVLRDIYKQMSTEDIAKLERKGYDSSDRLMIAEEFLAFKAQEGNRPNFIQKAIAWIRNKLRSLFGLKYSDNDINYLFELSRNALKKESKASKGESQKITSLDQVLDPKFMTNIYHGSPHSFDRFSTDKMGTGEGVQAYGWGLYFTDLEEIAKNYSESNDHRHVFDIMYEAGISTGMTFNAIKAISGYLRNRNLHTALQEDIDSDYYLGVVPNEDIEAFKKILRFANNYKEGINKFYDQFSSSRNLYKVKIHGDKTIDELNFLRWDKYIDSSVGKKISEQAKKENLIGLLDFIKEDVYFDGKNNKKQYPVGKAIYHTISNYFNQNGKDNPDKSASEFLLRAGIDGIQYPTEYLSKGSHEDSYNYVVFDENAIEIDEHIRFQKNEKAQTNSSTGNSNNGERPVDQTKTKAFKQWFGNSKVVDEKGEPLVVYHSTKKNFNEFELKNLSNGYFFSSSPTVNMTPRLGDKINPYQDGSSVMSVYLSIKNPKYIENIPKDPLFENLEINAAKTEGYDGLIIDGETYVAFDNTQIKSATGNNGDFDSNNPDIRFTQTPTEVEGIGEQPIERGKKIIDNKLDKVREIYQDRMLSVKRVQEEVKKRGGHVPSFANPYRDENLMHGKNNAEMDEYDKNIWEPLSAMVGKLVADKKISSDDLQKYMKAKHAPERNELLRQRYNDQDPDAVYAGSIDGVPMTDENAKKLIEKYEKKLGANEIVEFWDKVRAATQFSLDRQLADGFITQEEYNDYILNYNHYVPLRSWKGDKASDFFDYISDDLGTGFNNPLVKAKGRTSEADDPLPFIKSMAYTSIISGNKNKVKQSALNLARLNKDMTDLFIPSKVVWLVETSDGNWEETIIRPDQSLFDAGKVKTRMNNAHEQRNTRRNAEQHEVEVWEGGQKYILGFRDPDVARAINNQNNTLDPLAKLAQKFPGGITRGLSMLLTSKNPAFIPVNLIRDIQYAITGHAIKEDGDAIKFIKNMPIAMKATNRFLTGKADKNPNQLDAMYRDFRMNGGETGYVHINDIDDLKRRIEREIKRVDGTNSYLDKLGQSKIVSTMGEWLDYLATMSENTSRFATYITAIEMGKSKKEAASMAKDITVNFNRKGRISPILGSLYAFFNANIQGGHNLLHLIRNYPKPFAVAATSFIALGFIAAEMTRFYSPGDDDDDSVDKINQYIRHNYMVLPNPMWYFGKEKDKFITIPLLHGFRVFYSMGVIGSDFIHGKTKPAKAALDITSNTLDAFSPLAFNMRKISEGKLDGRPFVPTAFMPFYDIFENEDYAGRKVYREMFTKELEEFTPDSEKGLARTNPILKEATRSLNALAGGDKFTPAQYHINPVTGQITVEKWRGNLFDRNPAKIEHIIEGYTGGLGTFLNNSVKTLSNGIRVLAGDEEAQLYSSDVPVIRRFYRSSMKDNYWGEYYDIRSEVNAWEYFKNQKVKNMDFNGAFGMMNNNRLMELSYLNKAYDKQIKTVKEFGTDKQLEDIIKDYVFRASQINERYNKQK